MSIELSPVIKSISLDFARKSSPLVVFAKQGDNKSRKIMIQPTLNGVPVAFDYSYGYQPYFAEKKPDGKYVYNDAISVQDNGSLLLTLTDQALAAHGNATCCIVLKDENNEDILSSQNFILNIEFSAGAYENLASSDEILGLDGKIAEVNQLIEDIESMLGEGVFNSKSIPHMRFSAYEDGTDFSENWGAGMNYIGFAIAETAPAYKEEYQWARFASNVRDTVKITLKSDAWIDNKQTVICESILENSSAWSSFAPGYYAEYINNGIILESVSVGYAVFGCITKPESDMDVMLSVTDPLVVAGSADVPDGEQPTNSKYVVRDIDGNLSAINPKYTEYPNLIYRYEHTTNIEVHVSAVDLATGEFTAQAHGLTDGTVVVAVVNEPYHIGYPYRYLPGGLLLGQTNGSGRNAQYYYVSVVDENTFTLSTTNGGATVTFTEVSTMDLSKFHFEVHNKMELIIKDLPNLKELLVVIKGRMSMGYRYCMPYERASESGKLGVVAFDSSTSADQWGSLWLGNTGGWNSAYIEVEMKFVEERHVLVIADQDYLSFKSNSEIPVAFHVRGYMHIYMNRDDMTRIGMDDGAFINGTTVEVYSK